MKAIAIPHCGWLRRLAVLTFLVVVAAKSSFDVAAAQSNKRFRGYSSKFGVMAPDPNGKFRVYVETTEVHRLADQKYVHGFEVTRRDGLRFMGQYEVRFPEPIRVTPELEKSHTVLEGGRLIRSNSEIHWGLFSGPFWFSPDDPLGEYELKLFIDGDLYRTINYNVVPFGNQVEF